MNANVCIHLQGESNVCAFAIVFVVANNLAARETEAHASSLRPCCGLRVRALNDGPIQWRIWMQALFVNASEHLALARVQIAVHQSSEAARRDRQMGRFVKHG
jgi:hypothetical protein